MSSTGGPLAYSSIIISLASCRSALRCSTSCANPLSNCITRVSIDLSLASLVSWVTRREFLKGFRDLSTALDINTNNSSFSQTYCPSSLSNRATTLAKFSLLSFTVLDIVVSLLGPAEAVARTAAEKLASWGVGSNESASKVVGRGGAIVLLGVSKWTPSISISPPTGTRALRCMGSVIRASSLILVISITFFVSVHMSSLNCGGTLALQHKVVTRHGHNNEVSVCKALSFSSLMNIWMISTLLLSVMAAITCTRSCIRVLFLFGGQMVRKYLEGARGEASKTSSEAIARGKIGLRVKVGSLILTVEKVGYKDIDGPWNWSTDHSLSHEKS
ncbi:hypothetical protein HAX54_053373 [Datura stramonium]|uniref:Uncharacterized protein n=1 Tax=Datura stramonium TaxID=4076 RepID=A0ABS8T098_DATST|nr:hypothetical protein [Datura stramonium]